MSEAWRCFVAVPLPDPLRSALVAATEAWRADTALAGMRFADIDGAHLTIAFLGATAPDRIPAISAALNRVAGAHEPMRLATGGLGAFPSSGRARVLWYGVDDSDGRLATLAGALHQALGLDAPTRYRPHVTLARSRHRPIPITEWLRHARAPEGEIEVTRLELMRSHLGRGPARYERLATAELRAPARV